MATGYALFIVTVPNDRQTETNNQDPSNMRPSLCANLKAYLAEKIDNEPVWMAINDNKGYQVTFYAGFGGVSDRILRDLNKLEIGTKNGSQICVVPATLIMGIRDRRSTTTDILNGENDSSLPNGPSAALIESLKAKRKIYQHIDMSNFKKSVRARLMVHQVVDGIRAATTLSFDFLILLSLASMLAAFGLLENSSVIIVASMLVSPLMNPIMGIVFGLSVRDHSLCRRGVRNELIGLLLCILWGFIIGLCTTHSEISWGSSSNFPTYEMKSRGDLKRLWVGVFIALPSGAGVALSILGGNTGSLVGVAISASLLPPAVNCGLLFAYAVLSHTLSSVALTYATNGVSEESNQHIFQFQHRLRPNNPIINCSKYVDNGYSPFYSCNMAHEAAILGSCSLLLTVVNIICIISMALIIFRIKEVVPLNQENEGITGFFHHNVKVARDYNKTIQENEHNTGITFTAPKLSTITLCNENERSSDTIQRSFMNDSNSFFDLSDLQMLAKDFDLDIFNSSDRDLTKPDTEEKVLCLVNTLLDMHEESPASFVNFCRHQPYDTQTSARKEHASFDENVIRLLPPKWHDLLDHERYRRSHIIYSNMRRSNSYSAFTDQRPIRTRLNQSFNEQHEKSRMIKFQRKISIPRTNCPWTVLNEQSQKSDDELHMRMENNRKKVPTESRII